MTRVVELYYTVSDVCTLLRYSDTWVKQRIRAGAFGPGVLDIAGDYRIPASGINVFLSQHIFDVARVPKPHQRSAFLRQMRRMAPSSDGNGEPSPVHGGSSNSPH